jgi:hypothetical protein
MGDSKMNIPTVFQPFIVGVRAAFDYLITDYGFYLKDETAAGSEAWSTYENPTTRVTVHYELGSEPWVEIGQRETRDGREVQSASIGLELLLREHGNPLTDAVPFPREIQAAELTHMLRKRAEGLRVVGKDLLRGDFHELPKLQTKAETELKKREADLFGKQ